MPFKFVLCEMLTPCVGANEVNIALVNGLRRDRDARDARVRRVLESLATVNMDLILFPGWTLIGDEPPKWLIDASAGRTVVFEMLSSEGPRDAKGNRTARTFVVQRGEIIRGPIRQILATGDEAWAGAVRTPPGNEVVDALRADDRRWRLTTNRSAALIICGEINAYRDNAESAETDFAAAEVVLNPSHTRMAPQEAREKRKYLSGGGLLLCTANVHDGSANHNASYVTVEIYWKGTSVMSGSEDSVRSDDGAVRAERIWLGDDTRLVLGSAPP